MNLNLENDVMAGEASKLLLLTVAFNIFYINTSTFVLPLLTGAGNEAAGTVPVPPPGTLPLVGSGGRASHNRPLG